MKWLPNRLYTPLYVAIAGMVCFVGLGGYVFAPGMTQTLHHNTGRISGLIILSAGEQLPKQARVLIQVLDVSMADAAAVTISEEVIETVSDVPIPFSIGYDPDLIKASNRYAITISIYAKRANGLWRRVFRNTQQYPVITAGGTESVEVMVQRL